MIPPPSHGGMESLKVKTDISRPGPGHFIEGLEKLIHEQSKGEGGERRVKQTGEVKVKEAGNVSSA
jgi:hypothetical protein